MQRRDVGVACRLQQRSDGDGRGQHVLSFNMSLLDHRIAGLSQFVTMALSATSLPGQGRCRMNREHHRGRGREARVHQPGPQTCLD